MPAQSTPCKRRNEFQEATPNVVFLYALVVLFLTCNVGLLILSLCRNKKDVFSAAHKDLEPLENEKQNSGASLRTACVSSNAVNDLESSPYLDSKIGAKLKKTCKHLFHNCSDYRVACQHVPLPSFTSGAMTIMLLFLSLFILLPRWEITFT